MLTCERQTQINLCPACCHVCSSLWSALHGDALAANQHVSCSSPMRTCVCRLIPVSAALKSLLGLYKHDCQVSRPWQTSCPSKICDAVQLCSKRRWMSGGSCQMQSARSTRSSTRLMSRKARMVKPQQLLRSMRSMISRQRRLRQSLLQWLLAHLLLLPRLQLLRR